MVEAFGRRDTPMPASAALGWSAPVNQMTGTDVFDQRIVKEIEMSGLVAKVGATLVSLTLASSALAGGYGYGHRGHHGHGRHTSDWVAPLLILGIAGAAIAASSQREAPRQVYTPPVEYRPAPTYAPTYAPAYGYAPTPQSDGPLWWCGSAGQYYPAVPYCPENWQLIQRR